MVLHCCGQVPKATMTLSRKLKKGTLAFGLSTTRKTMHQNKGMGIGKASVYHVLVVIFLEFFSWGLLVVPMMNTLKETFPDHTLLMNGLIGGIKGIFSFLSAPLVGALSDCWGRKSFLLVTVFFTCMPIPLMKFSPWWYFALLSVSGILGVTFSVVFAYVSDVTDEDQRSMAFGMISATFAASLITSPAIGDYISKVYSDSHVVILATAIATFDVFFILVAVPESLPESLRQTGSLSWERADPFAALRRIGHDHTVVILCVIVFLSYIPEAGEYNCLFLYLKQMMLFSTTEIATFIAVVGILSVLAQTLLLGLLMRYLGNKGTILVGLLFQTLQMIAFGFGKENWIMWFAGCMAGLSSLTYPAISSLISTCADAESQGVSQGMVTGIRGLCGGLGPALFGLIFFMFHVKLTEDNIYAPPKQHDVVSSPAPPEKSLSFMPGPPFAISSLLLIAAFVLATFIPDKLPSLSMVGKKRDPAVVYTKVPQVCIDDEEVTLYSRNNPNSDNDSNTDT